MDIEDGLRRLGYLEADYHRISTATQISRDDQLAEIRKAGHALQFELLLHMSCRRFFKEFNIT